MVLRNSEKTEKACEILFGSDFIVSEETLEYLQPEGIKAAYRQRLKACHPDTSGKEEDKAIIGTLQAAAQWLLEGKTAVKAPVPSVDSQMKNEDLFHRGPLPKRRLRLAEYLFYSGSISYEVLIKALAWHAYGQPKIGQIMLDLGMLSRNDIHAVVFKKNRNKPFGLTAQKMGLVDKIQLNSALAEQRRRVRRIGCYFIDNGLLSPGDLHLALTGQFSHNSRIKA